MGVTFVTPTSAPPPNESAGQRRVRAPRLLLSAPRAGHNKQQSIRRLTTPHAHSRSKIEPRRGTNSRS